MKRQLFIICKGDGEIDISLERAYAIRPYGKWGKWAYVTLSGSHTACEGL